MVTATNLQSIPPSRISRPAHLIFPVSLMLCRVGSWPTPSGFAQAACGDFEENGDLQKVHRGPLIN